MLEKLIGRQSLPPELAIFRRHCDEAAGKRKAQVGELGFTQALIVKACIAGDDELRGEGALIKSEAQRQQTNRYGQLVKIKRFEEVRAEWLFFRYGNGALLVFALAHCEHPARPAGRLGGGGARRRRHLVAQEHGGEHLAR